MEVEGDLNKGDRREREGGGRGNEGHTCFDGDALGFE